MLIQYSKAAVKCINSMDSQSKRRIKAGIEGLTQVPPIGDIKKLQGDWDDTFRLRVGKYRIIYRKFTDNKVEVLYIMDIGSRGDIYK